MVSSTDVVAGPNGESVLVRSWPAVGESLASLLIVHGLNEHSGRYEHVGAAFAEAGLSVTSFDLPGHGATTGTRAYVEEFSHFLDAIDQLRPTSGKLVLYGHSMGGLIALSYALDRIPPDVLLLSAPAIDATAPAWQRKAAPLLGRLLPKFALPNPFESADISRDPAVVEAYESDPLVTSKTTTRLGAEIFATMDDVQGSLTSLTIPTFVVHGGADTIVPARHSAALGELPNVTRKLYPKLKHECHNEPEGPEVIQDMVEFVRASL